MGNYSRSMYRYMIGKNDRAGRTLTEEQRNYSYPNSLYWQENAWQLEKKISKIVSAEKYDIFYQMLTGEISYMLYVFCLRRLFKFVTANHDCTPNQMFDAFNDNISQGSY